MPGRWRVGRKNASESGFHMPRAIGCTGTPRAATYAPESSQLPRCPATKIRPRPFASAAFRLSEDDHYFNEDEHELHMRVLKVIHDKEFGRLMGQEAVPRMVYRPKTPLFVNPDGTEEFSVEYHPEQDPVRMALMDGA